VKVRKGRRGRKRKKRRNECASRRGAKGGGTICAKKEGVLAIMAQNPWEEKGLSRRGEGPRSVWFTLYRGKRGGRELQKIHGVPPRRGGAFLGSFVATGLLYASQRRTNADFLKRLTGKKGPKRGKT